MPILPMAAGYHARRKQIIDRTVNRRLPELSPNTALPACQP
ncbi:hypothetical protein [Geotalea uraniireducens]|nr:hypothetical protein [Geotalea uraniireducens]